MVEKAVIARIVPVWPEGVYRSGGVRFHVCEQRSAAGLLAELRSELSLLHAKDPRTWRAHAVDSPVVLTRFIEFMISCIYGDATVADAANRRGRGRDPDRKLSSAVSFCGHPAGDIENHTIVAFSPCICCGRLASTSLAACNPDSLHQNNTEARELGYAGWQAMWSARRELISAGTAPATPRCRYSRGARDSQAAALPASSCALGMNSMLSPAPLRTHHFRTGIAPRRTA